MAESVNDQEPDDETNKNNKAESGSNQEPNDETHKNHQKDTDFFADLSDDRKDGYWQSRYNKDAKTEINGEAIYLALVFIASLLIPFIIGLYIAEHKEVASTYMKLKMYVFSFCGGILGGTMYSAKWLVHTVAKNTWNLDRQLWRFFTPFVSGALAFSIILLMDSGVINIVDQKTLTIQKAYGIGFLIGYFSDNAIGKLTEVAKVFFGSTKS